MGNWSLSLERSPEEVNGQFWYARGRTRSDEWVGGWMDIKVYGRDSRSHNRCPYCESIHERPFYRPSYRDLVKAGGILDFVVNSFLTYRPMSQRVPSADCVSCWNSSWPMSLIKTNKLHGLSPRENYTDRTTASCRRSDCQLLRIEGATLSEWQIPTAVFSVF
jgi:hypothetical protein